MSEIGRIEEAARKAVKRCCPECCEHCYMTATEVMALYAGEYARGFDDGKKAGREEKGQ